MSDETRLEPSKTEATPNSSAKAKAERLRKLRNLANLTRSKFCVVSDSSINTVKGWEIGRLGGIPEDAAQMVVNTMKQFNVISTVEWLLEGVGPKPVVIPQVNEISVYDEKIQKELSIFKNFYGDILFTEILEQTKAGCPFEPSDVVAGVSLKSINKQTLEGKYCIVVNKAGQTKVKKVLKKLNENVLMLGSITDETTETEEIQKAAIISRHYKLIM